MNEEGTLEIVAKHLTLAMRPLKQAVTDVDNFRAFMLRLGWNVQSLPPAYNALADHVDDAMVALAALESDVTPEKIESLFDAIKALYSATQDLTTAPAGVDSGSFLADIGERLFEVLLVNYLAEALPIAYSVFLALDVITIEAHAATKDRPAFVETRFKFSEIPRIVTDPLSIPKRAYGWGSSDLDFPLIAEHLHELFLAFDLPTSIEQVNPELAAGFQASPESTDGAIDVQLKIPITEVVIEENPTEVGIVVLELPAEQGKLPGVIIQPLIPSALGLNQPITDNLTLSIRADSDIARTFGIIVRPSNIAVRYPFEPGTLPPSAGFGAELNYHPTETKLLLGTAKQSRLQFIGARAALGLDYNAGDLDLSIEVEMTNLSVVLALSEQDSFLGRLFVGSDLTIPIPLGLRWSSKRGLAFVGSASFQVVVAPHLMIGPITVDTVQLSMLGTVSSGQPPGLTVSTAVGISGAFGPVAFAVQGIGINLKLIFTNGNAGPFEINAGFKPPDGLGIVVAAGPITGGGFLSIDTVNGRYAGVLQLNAGTIAITAIGLLDTKLPGGVKGFSFLIIITAKFSPIQLGFGFALTGLGGLAGIHRSIVTQALQDGVRAKSLDHILFPENPVRDAPKLISDLQTIFPPTEGQFIFGPMAIITWGTPAIVEAELGIILELPNPIRLVILGQVNVTLPDKKAPVAVVQLHIDIVGIIDFTNKNLSIDASLHDSKLLEFNLYGDMALRLSWGEQPNFALSIGGFNPHFQPPPNFPTLRRLTVALGSGENPRFSLQAYLAVTSNSVQFGALAELYAEAAGFNVYGWIGFDVLFIFNPFSLIADFSAGVALRRGSTLIASIYLAATLTGPTPWHAWGEASISILFISVTVSFDATFGEEAQLEVAVDDPWKVLEAEIKKIGNWSATLPTGSSQVVSLIAPGADESGLALINPLGGLTLRQKAVPFDHTLTKFGQGNLAAAQRFIVGGVTVGTQSAISTSPLLDYFAPGHFEDLTDAEKMSRPSFERMQAGVTIASNAVAFGSVKGTDYSYETVIIDAPDKPKPSRPAPPDYKLKLNHQTAALQRSAAAQSSLWTTGLEKFAPSPSEPALVTLNEEEFVIIDTASGMDTKIFVPFPSTKSAAYQALAEHLAKNPNEKRQLEVTPVHETQETV